jgi:hypothetical protein
MEHIICSLVLITVGLSPALSPTPLSDISI